MEEKKEEPPKKKSFGAKVKSFFRIGKKKTDESK